MPVAIDEIVAVLATQQTAILDSWVDAQLEDARINTSLISEEELRRQSRDLLKALAEADLDGGDAAGEVSPPVRRALDEFATRRDRVGMRPSGTATSILILKDAWLPHLLEAYGEDRDRAVAAVTDATRLVDSLAMLAYERMVQNREETITQQAEELLEISTPVVQVWDGVVAAPLIGMLDSERTQRFMERLLDRIVQTNSSVALVDITGVPAIDTQTAQHLIDTINAVKLLGSQVILTGVRPSIAQTLVHLGITLTGVRTRSSFAGGLRVAMEILDLELASTRNGQG
jgi:rsbT co-antagonist protein RsbR